MTLPLAPAEFWVATEPELKYLPSGLAVCEFRVKAANKKKGDDGKWVDGKTLWANAHVYSKENMPFAENTYESVKKGDDVILIGRIYTRSYETKAGGKGLSVDIDVDGLGPSLTFRVTPHGEGKKQASTAQQGQGGTNTQQGTPAASERQAGGEGDFPF